MFVVGKPNNFPIVLLFMLNCANTFPLWPLTMQSSANNHCFWYARLVCWQDCHWFLQGIPACHTSTSTSLPAAGSSAGIHPPLMFFSFWEPEHLRRQLALSDQVHTTCYMASQFPQLLSFPRSQARSLLLPLIQQDLSRWSSFFLLLSQSPSGSAWLRG